MNCRRCGYDLLMRCNFDQWWSRQNMSPLRPRGCYRCRRWTTSQVGTRPRAAAAVVAVAAGVACFQTTDTYAYFSTRSYSCWQLPATLWSLRHWHMTGVWGPSLTCFYWTSLSATYYWLSSVCRSRLSRHCWRTSSSARLCAYSSVTCKVRSTIEVTCYNRPGGSRLLTNKIASQAKADHPRICVFSYAHLTFYNLDPMTLIYEHELDILKVCLCTLNEVSVSTISQVRARTEKTHRQTRLNALPRITVYIPIYYNLQVTDISSWKSSEMTHVVEHRVKKIHR